MMLYQLRVAAVLATLVMAMLAAPPAIAGDPTAGTLENGKDPGLTPEEQAQTDLKDRLAQDYLLVRAGELDRAVFEKEWVRFTGSSAGLPSAQIADGPEPMDILNLTQVAQSNSYYCGPATAREMLGYRGVTAGPENESLTQSHLAHHCYSGYLCTDALGQTPWYNSSAYPRPMQSTLNEWLGSSFYVVTLGSTNYQSHLQMNIDSGYPIAVDVYERADASKPHLVGHPTNRAIAHWIAVHGYDAYGAYTYYADSVHNVPTSVITWAGGVPAHAWVPSGSNGLSYMMDDTQTFKRGHIW